MEADVRRLKEIEQALKRANQKCSELRKKKKEAEKKLYKSMERQGIEIYEGYKAVKLAPKAKIKRKPAKEKKADAINLFRYYGVDDPETFYEEFEKTQKALNPDNEDET